MPNLGLPLAGGFLQEIPPNASQEVQNAALNQVIRRLNAQLKTQMFSDGNNKRMLFGFQAGGWKNGTKDFGIKISFEGVDVDAATDDQLLFSMDMDTWRWFDPTARNYVNIGLRSSDTYGFEMAKPGDELNEPA